MSASPTSSDFEALLNTALTKYTEQTGKDLRNHPLAHRMEDVTPPIPCLMYSKNKHRHLKNSGAAIAD